MFKVTTLDMDNVPKEDGKCDFSKDLFGKKTYITGSGQLHGEAFAMAFNKILTKFILLDQLSEQKTQILKHMQMSSG